MWRKSVTNWLWGGGYNGGRSFINFAHIDVSRGSFGNRGVRGSARDVRDGGGRKEGDASLHRTDKTTVDIGKT